MFKLDAKKIRVDFPVYDKGKEKIIYFDNACMTFKPRQVIDAMLNYYENFPACHGRSVHKFSEKVTSEFNHARDNLKKFFSVGSDGEIIFTKNTTEAINIVANGMNFSKGDIVVNSDREHSSNIVPWLYLEKAGRIQRRYVKSTETEEFDLEDFKIKVKGARLVSVVATSNLDGYHLPIKEIIKIAHDSGALVLLDAAQAAPHKELNFKKLDADFIAVSGHKMLGPTATGFLYGKKEHLEKLIPFILGGDTVSDTTYDSYCLEKIPERFEAGLQDYAGVIGFSAAATYLRKIGMSKVEEHEKMLTKYALDKLSEMDGITLLGVNDIKKKSGVISFSCDKLPYHQVSIMLDKISNIATRSGQHCLHSWFNSRGIKGSVRVSFYIYNTTDEIDVFVSTLKKLLKTF